MSEPYLDETNERWILQEYFSERWMLRADGELAEMKAAHARRLEEHPERIYRVVKEIVHTTREVIIAQNEPAAPRKPKKETPDEHPAAAGEADTSGEDQAADGTVPEPVVPADV